MVAPTSGRKGQTELKESSHAGGMFGLKKDLSGSSYSRKQKRALAGFDLWVRLGQSSLLTLRREQNADN